VSSGGAALEHLVRAEKRWGINWEDGSPASVQRDLRHLRWVCQELRQRDTALTQVVGDVENALCALDDLLGNVSNFRSDGRMMRPEAARAYAIHTADLRKSRAALRELLGARVQR
jgi:hypothetical protein